MATIWKRGPHQFCVRVRRNEASETKTFETRQEADKWARIVEGKVTGEEPTDDLGKGRDTTLYRALEWYEKVILPKTPRSSKGKLTQVTYWKASEFANWSLVALHPWDLIDWRRKVLDEDNAEDGETIGPDADFGASTCIHRLNLISHLYGQWSLIHKVPLDNPVVRGVRPSPNDGRDRRLDPQPDQAGKSECDRLYEISDRSNSGWLGAAVRLAVETCTRQAELAGLIWERVHLKDPHPHIDLPKTKNDRPRRVPLSTRAVKAFQSLMPADVGGIGKRKVLSIDTPRAIGHAFRASVKEQEFPDLRWHDLRHEAISRLFENTDLRDHEIMAITGHLSTQMLKRYSHLRSHMFAARLG